MASPKAHRRRSQERHANDDSKLRFVLVPSDSRAGTMLTVICSAFSTDRRPKSYFSPKLTTLRFPKWPSNSKGFRASFSSPTAKATYSASRITCSRCRKPRGSPSGSPCCISINSLRCPPIASFLAVRVSRRTIVTRRRLLLLRSSIRSRSCCVHRTQRGKCGVRSSGQPVSVIGKVAVNIRDDDGTLANR